MARRGSLAAELSEAVRNLSNFVGRLGGPQAFSSWGNLDQALTHAVRRASGRVGGDPHGRVAGNMAFLHAAQADVIVGQDKIRDALWGVAQAQVAYNQALGQGRPDLEREAHSLLERARGRHQSAVAHAANAQAEVEMRGRAVGEAQAGSGMFHRLADIAGRAGVGGGKVGQLLDIGTTAETAAATGEVAGPVGLAISLGVETFVTKMKMLGSGLEHGLAALTSPDFDQSAKEAADGLSDLATSVDPTLGALTRLAAGIALTPVLLREMDQGLLNANLRLSQFSGHMAVVGAQQQIRSIMREMQQGNTQAASAERLQESLDGLKDTLAPLESAVQRFKNELFAKLTELTDKATKPAADALTKVIDELTKKLFGTNKPDPNTSRGWWDAAGDWTTKADRPPGFDDVFND